jgi:phosphoribosylamine--glycine ligase/phosphoribosylformylglycinamidine cyclo-ligase
MTWNTRPWLHVQASGLAEGKGVFLPENTEEAVQAARSLLEEGALGEAGREVVVEEHLQGDEVSVLAFSDGQTVVGMPAAQVKLQ